MESRHDNRPSVRHLRHARFHGAKFKSENLFSR